MARQLTLFSTPINYKQGASEFAKHCVIVDAVRRFLEPGWEWTHLPFGEHRLPATAAKLKRMGVRAGWPDLLFVSRDGRHHYVELKKTGEKPNKDQVRLGEFFAASGTPYLLSSSVTEILTTLQQWGVLVKTVKF